MIEGLARLLLDYNLKRKYADKDFIEKALNLIIDEKELSNYISRITIVTNYFESIKENSHYSFKDMSLVINAIDEYYKSDYYLTRKYNRYYIFNTLILITILHELDHVDLFKRIKLNENSLDVLFGKIVIDIKEPKMVNMSDEEFDNISEEEERELIKEYIVDSLILLKNGLYYQHNHDMAPFERRANLHSYIEFSKVLKLLYKSCMYDYDLEKIRLTCLKTFLKKVKYGYHLNNNITNSPSLDYLKKINSDKLNLIDIYNSNNNIVFNDSINLYNLQERLLYGLPISKYELNLINKKTNPFDIFKK